MAARSSPGGFVVATITNPGSFMATIINNVSYRNGYCRDRILRDTPTRAEGLIPNHSATASKTIIIMVEHLLWSRGCVYLVVPVVLWDQIQVISRHFANHKSNNNLRHSKLSI